VEERPKIGVSKQFMIDMTLMIRGQFCPDWDDKAWNTHLWLVQRTVIYPAAWLNKRAIFVPPDRYRELLLELLQEVKRKGGAIKFPPGYLLKCVQDHMRFNADRYNTEGKVARDRLTKLMGTFPTAEARPDFLVKTLAAGGEAIQKPKRRRSTPAHEQGTLAL
jgi:hypothetical protein